MSSTDTNQASEDGLRETIERLLRFNCPNGCDGNGSYPEMGSDGEWEQGQCQWCFEYGMPARDAIQALIRTEKLKLLADVRGRVVGEGDFVDAEILKKLYDRAYSRGYNDRGYENSYNSQDYRSAEAIAPVIAKIRGGYDKRFAALNKLEAEV